MQIYGSNILTLDFTNNFAMVNGEDYCVDKDLTPNRTSVFGQYGGPLTFSRGSRATVTDKTGRLTYAPNNLFLQSGWAGAVSGTPGTAPTSWTFSISGGSLTVTPSALGNRLTFTTTTSARHFIYQNVVASAFTSYLFSVNVVDNPDSVVISRIIGGSQAPTGTVSTYYLNGVSVPGSTIAPNNSRISILYQIAATAGTLAQRIGMGTEGNTLGSVTLEYPQMETVTYQTVPVAYIPTTTAAYYGPRFDYDPLTLSNKGLLIEETRSNLLTYSEQFDNATWTKTGITISANVTTSPDGTVDADKLVEDSSAGTHSATSTAVSKSAVATTYTYSLYAKAAERSALQMRIADGSNSANRVICDVNLATQTVSTSVGGTFTNASATITHVGNGWFRITLTGTSSTETSLFALAFLANPAGTISYTGTTGSGIFIWGAQLEAGAFATSYIPTVASTVTRSADVATMTGSNFSNWYNQNEGTVVSSFSSVIPTSSSQGIWTISDGTNSERWFAFCTNNTIRHFMVDGGVTQASIDVGTYSPNTVFKSAMAIRLNSAQASVNGALGVEDTSATIPTVDRMDIGNRIGAVFLNGWIRSLQYYPYRLSDSQLQALTV